MFFNTLKEKRQPCLSGEISKCIERHDTRYTLISTLKIQCDFTGMKD